MLCPREWTNVLVGAKSLQNVESRKSFTSLNVLCSGLGFGGAYRFLAALTQKVTGSLTAARSSSVNSGGAGTSA